MWYLSIVGLVLFVAAVVAIVLTFVWQTENYEKMMDRSAEKWARETADRMRREVVKRKYEEEIESVKYSAGAA